jgi:sigma-B regulation protein RsbU (phosphoserine phosphatase)
VLAGMEGVRYRQAEMMLEPGDTLYLYTDGVTEATDKALTLYGEERLLESLNTDEAFTAKEILEKVTRSLDAFVNGAEQADDITMVGFRYLSRTAGAKGE